MAQIIRHRDISIVKERRREFRRVATPTAGCSFPCDEQGEILPEAINPASWANWHECLAGTIDGDPVRDLGVVEWDNVIKTPARLRCDCGEELDLVGFTNTCLCWADYTMSGQRLAPRSQWGEETGESVSDILSVDSEGGW